MVFHMYTGFTISNLPILYVHLLQKFIYNEYIRPLFFIARCFYSFRQWPPGLPPMVILIDRMGSNNLIGEVHAPLTKEVGQECNGSKWVVVFYLCSITSFHESLKLAVQLENAPFNLNTNLGVHLIVTQRIFVNIWGCSAWLILRIMNTFSPWYPTFPRRYPK